MHSLILTSVKNVAEARKIGRRLIEERLAACVTVLPQAESLFWWKGKIDRAKEALLLVKTSRKKVKQAISQIKSSHSYALPEIISFSVSQGYFPYLRWIDESVG